MRLHDPFDFPDFQHPRALKEPPQHTPGMIWEQKLDGVRAMVSNSALKLRSINLAKHSLELRSGRPIPRGCLLDGEIMATDDNFTAVQGRVTRQQWRKLEFVPFDILYWDGKSLRAKPLLERRARLLTIDPGPLVLSDEDEQGNPKLATVPLEWEGVVGKHLGEGYATGRSGSWVKWKNTGMIKCRLLRFEEGEGSWKGIVGKVVFGLKIQGQEVILGRASGLTTLQRWEFQHRPEQYLGRPIMVRHYGIIKQQFRNAIFEGFADEDEGNPKSR